MTTIWTESYRPNSLEGYVFRDQAQQESVESWITAKTIPHLLFTGGPGCGKTTLAKILIKQLDIDPYDVLEINASRENGVDTIRDKITNFVQTMPFGELKVVMLDECLDENTLVCAMRDNQEITIPISELNQVTDLVKSYNINGKRVEWKAFELFDKGTRETLEIEFDNNEVVICTPEHKWYVQDNNGEVKVVRADELYQYEHVVTPQR